MGALQDYYGFEVSDNKLAAKIIQLKPIEDLDEDLTEDRIKTLLHELGIVYGIEDDAISKLLQGNLQEAITIANGKSAINGENARLEPVYPSLGGKGGHENEIFDLRNVVALSNVSQGTIIGKKILLTSGTDGMNVYGEVIRAKPGKDLKLRPGKNTRIKDDSEIVATIDGQMSTEKKVIHVYPVYEVNGDLDMKIGNIDFIGSVNIRGNVPAGYTVQAKGDIRVQGSVEGALLTSGGSIFVLQGVVAQGKGQIEAKGDIYTSFVNQGSLKADGDIYVSQSILHSEIEALGSVVCKERRGNIVGGQVSAGKGVEVNEVGNEMNTLTQLFLGTSERVYSKQKEARLRHEESSETLKKLSALCKAIEAKEKSGPLSANDRILKLKVRNNLVTVNEEYQQAEDQLSELNDLLNKVDDANIIVYKDLFPSVFIHFGKYRRKLLAKHQCVRVSLDSSEIKLTTL